MRKSTLIKDKATRDAVNALEEKADSLKKIPQLPADATTKQIIDTINKITDSLKRR